MALIEYIDVESYSLSFLPPGLEYLFVKFCFYNATII